MSMTKNELDKLFQEAESKTNELEDRVVDKKGRDERLLSCNKSKIVLFRMVRDTKNNILKLPYKYNSFVSPISKKSIPVGVSPTLWGEEDYVKAFQIDLWNRGQNDLAKLLYPKDRCRVNIFVLSDSSDDSAKGTFKVWDYSSKEPIEGKPKTGAPFLKFIKKVLNDPELELSLRNLYSLGPEGTTIKMTITKADDDPFPEFEFEIYNGKKNKFFDDLSPEKAEELTQKHSVDLFSMMEKPKSREEIEKILNTQLLGVPTSEGSEPVLGFDDDDIPMSFDSPKPKETEKEVKSDDSDLDEEFENIMAQFEEE